MVTSNKTNPNMDKVVPKVSAPDMLRRVIQLGKAARTAALDLCYAATCYILLVNHFTDSKDKGFMTRTDAVAFLTKQLRAEAGIEGGMLDIYIRNASTLAGMITGSPKLFTDVLVKLATAASVDDMLPTLAHWMDTNHASRVYRTKIDSLRGLSEALGYSTGRDTGGGGALTAAKVPDRIANTIKAVEKMVTEGDKSGKKTTAGTIAKSIVGAVAASGGADQSAILAREAISHIWNLTVLDGLEQAIKQQRQKAKEMAAKAEASVKETPTKITKANKTGRSTTHRASV